MSKLRISYSRIKQYLSCPYTFHLQKSHKPVFSSSTKDSMRSGRIFESLVLGDKDDFLAKLPSRTLKSEKFKKIQNAANNFIDEFPTDFKNQGNSYIRYELEFEDYLVSSELDYIGKLSYYDDGNLISEDKCIVDLKYTKSMEWGWEEFYFREDVLQVMMYSYLHFKINNEVLNGYYLVVEGEKLDKPVYSIKRIVIKEDHYNWVEDIIKAVAYDYGLIPNVGQSCLGSKRKKGRCAYLEFCSYGRSLLQNVKTIEFENLKSKR